MFSLEPEVYGNKDIELRIFRFDGYNRYWIKGSVGYIEFDQNNFDALLELLIEYNKEVNKVSFWARLRSKIRGR